MALIGEREDIPKKDGNPADKRLPQSYAPAMQNHGLRLLIFFTATALLGGHAVAELRVPAFTAYLAPETEGARVSSRSGISGWNSPAVEALWFGDLKTAGKLECSVILRLPTNATSNLRLSLAGQSHEVTIRGSGAEAVTARFGEFEIAAPGYQRFTLTSLNGAGQPNGDLEALVLNGPATEIRAGNDATDEFHRTRESLEIVWTGPVSKESSFRRTDQALLALIQQAKTSIIIVTFATYKVPHIAAALVAAAAQGVQVALILESMEESDGKVTVNAITGLGEELANAAAVYVWPLENRGADSEGKHGSLHVKCAVADATTALISSANLTEYAMNLNMELGLLVKGGKVPRNLDAHLRALIRNRVVIPLAGSNQSV